MLCILAERKLTSSARRARQAVNSIATMACLSEDVSSLPSTAWRKAAGTGRSLTSSRRWRKEDRYSVRCPEREDEHGRPRAPAFIAGCVNAGFAKGRQHHAIDSSRWSKVARRTGRRRNSGSPLCALMFRPSRCGARISYHQYAAAWRAEPAGGEGLTIMGRSREAARSSESTRSRSERSTPKARRDSGRKAA